MLLAIDVGNTETKLGCFSPEGELRRTWRVATDVRRTADEYGVIFSALLSLAHLDRQAIRCVAIASVVPKLDPVLADACVELVGVAPYFLRADEQQIIEVQTERPEEVGADLIAAAIGARTRYGAPLIVVSYGTATVFMAISPAGAYVGVAIAPGIGVSLDALVGQTAKLPQIALERPERALGRTTVEALQAGIVYGFVGQTEALVARFRQELGVAAPVVATGGLAQLVGRQTELFASVDPHLGLEGLRQAFIRHGNS
ncbi:MAG: type III pantothenate kinase [Vulcanimicrobiaceae bacterium]